MAKNLVVGPILAANFFFKNMAWAVTRNHGQLSPLYNIRKK